MTRLEQAKKWWVNQESKLLYQWDIPKRHFEVLRKHREIFNVSVFPHSSPFGPYQMPRKAK